MSLNNKKHQSLLENPLEKLSEKELLKLASEFIEKRNRTIDEFYNKHKSEISKEEIIEIVSLKANELAAKIRNKEITSTKAFLCYALNCCTVAKELNTIADVNFEKGLKEAKHADDIIKKHDKKLLPPLIGLPISIKDHIPVKDYIDTCGILVNMNFKAEKDCLIVEKLKQLGAVVLCKSNVPQVLMCAESSNNIYGACLNIWDKERTTGGSSGGEGGLLQSFCSPFGFGSDIGGSIRAPCHYSGVYGFKPTSNKLGFIGLTEADRVNCFSLNPWRCSTGMISRSIEDLIFFSKLLFGSMNEDLYSCYLDLRSFDDGLYSKSNIKIGYFHNYDEIECLVDIKNSIEFIKDKIVSSDNSSNTRYTTKEIDLNSFKDLFFQAFRFLYSAAYPQMYYCLKNEKPSSNYNFLHYSLGNKENKSEKDYKELDFSSLYKEPRLSKYYDCLKAPLSDKQVYDDSNLFAIRKDELLNYLKQQDLDVLILPVYPFPAPKNGHCDLSNFFAFYNFLENMTDMPSVIIPVGTTQSNKKMNFSKTKYSGDNKNKGDSIYKLIEEDFCEKELSLPYCIQVVSFPGKDELCLKVAEDISRLLNIDFNDIKKDNNQTKEFWKLRKIN